MPYRILACRATTWQFVVVQGGVFDLLLQRCPTPKIRRAEFESASSLESGPIVCPSGFLCQIHFCGLGPWSETS